MAVNIKSWYEHTLQVCISFSGYLATTLGIPSLKAFADSLLVYQMDAKNYVCCPTCSAVYPMRDSVEQILMVKLFLKRAYVCFPRNKACYTLINVRTSAGSTALYPRMFTCHKSLI